MPSPVPDTAYFQRISFEQESPHVVDGYVLPGRNVLLAILSVGSLDGQMETSTPRTSEKPGEMIDCLLKSGTLVPATSSHGPDYSNVYLDRKIR